MIRRRGGYKICADNFLDSDSAGCQSAFASHDERFRQRLVLKQITVQGILGLPVAWPSETRKEESSSTRSLRRLGEVGRLGPVATLNSM